MSVCQNNGTEVSVIQGAGVLLGFRQLGNPFGKLIENGSVKTLTQSRVALAFICFFAPFAAVIYAGDAGHAEAEGINKRQMLFVLQNACHSGHIVVVHEGEKMLAFIKSPVFRSELTEQGMDDFKQIHAVEAGMQTLVAFVIGNGMQHGIVHHAVVIAVQHFAEQEEILLFAVGEAAQASDKIFIQTVSHIQTQTVDVKIINPVVYGI